MKKIIVSIVILIILVCSAVFCYKYWKATPEYAFIQIKKSIENHDRNLFYDYVDVDSLVKRAVDVLLQEMNEKTPASSSNEWEQLGASLASGLVSMMKPKLIEMAKDQIDQLIEARSDISQKESQSKSSAANGSETPIDKINFDLTKFGGFDLKEKIKEGKITIALIQVQHALYGIPLEIRLKFRETDKGHLQIAEIENLADIFNTLEKAGHDWKVTQNKPIRDRLDSTVQMAGLTKRNLSDSWGIEKKVVFTLKAKNVSQGSISEWHGKIVFSNSDGNEVITVPIKATHDKFIPNTEQELVFQVEINPFISEQAAIWEADYSKLTGNLRIDKAYFIDGEKVSIPYPDVE